MRTHKFYIPSELFLLELFLCDYSTNELPIRTGEHDHPAET